MKKIFYILSMVLIYSISFSLKVGLDSGHSIKELYKSGGSFNIKKMVQGQVKTKSYYSVAWPEGGVRLEYTDGKHKGELSGAYSATKRNVYGTYVKMNNAVDLEKWGDDDSLFIPAVIPAIFSPKKPLFLPKIPQYLWV